MAESRSDIIRKGKTAYHAICKGEYLRIRSGFPFSFCLTPLPCSHCSANQSSSKAIKYTVNIITVGIPKYIRKVSAKEGARHESETL